MTANELAKLLGISRGTVSRVLNNNPNVKEETRKRVQAALEEYKYVPNETARSLVMKKNLRLAVIVFSEPAFFWKQVESGVNTALQELKPQGVTVDYFSTDIMNPKEQLDLLCSLPKKGYDGIVIAPNNPLILSYEIDKLSSTGYPIVIINVEIPSVQQLCYIGCDYVQAGILAAELMAKSLDASRQHQVSILTLNEPVSAIEQRITGFRRELSKHPTISIGQILHFDRKASQVYESVLMLLSETPHLEGIFVSFSALEQTAQAVLDASPKQKPVVIGYDLNEEIYRYLKLDAVSATICHEPIQQGYLSVKLLSQYLKQQKLPNNTIMYNKLEAVFASNAKYYFTEHTKLEL